MLDTMTSILYGVIHSKIENNHLVDYKTVYPLFKFHSLEPFLEYARRLKLLNLTEIEKNQLNKMHKTAIYKTAIQEEEFIQIKKALSKDFVPFLSLKGPLIRKLYPSPEMRTMADLDIIVQKKDLKKVKNIMMSLGYVVKQQGGNHDIYYKKPFMNVEIHRNMIDKSYELSKYYKNIWTKAILKDNFSTEHILSDEDTYLFIIAHSAKHYGAGGTGIRSVCDIYFYLKAFKNLDDNYIRNELSNLHLTKYEHHLKSLALGWFEHEPLQEEDIIVGEYMLHSGVYGVQRNAVVSSIALESEVRSLRYRKWKFLLKRAFPSYQNMKSLFPSLTYLPFLLPLFYFYRIIKALLLGKVVSQTYELKKIKEVDVKSHQKIKEITGRK